MRLYDWLAIQQYHDAGHGFVKCARKFGFSHTAWIKAIKRGELIARFRSPTGQVVSINDRRRIYDWQLVQQYYDAGHSFRDCREKFGFATMAWYKARQRGELVARPLGMPLDELLERRGSRRNVKKRLLRAGMLENRCDECGLTEWLGKALNMHLDHINGVKDDHRFDNLRMLCPNCHSQTPTYGGKNVKRRSRRLHDEPSAV